jgi:hypothetical protein
VRVQVREPFHNLLEKCNNRCYTMKCEWHLCGKELEGQRRRFCSDGCKSKFFVTKYRQDLKRKLVEYKGGKCELCGYNRCIAALEFHHQDPNEKDFGIAYKGRCVTFDEAKREVDRCLLLCANCHREKHC